MNAAAVTYVIAVSVVLIALAILLPRPDEWHYPFNTPHRRLGNPAILHRDSKPEEHWPEHVGATEDSPTLTDEIARIEADPSTPELLSGRELAEREAGEVADLFASFDEALRQAVRDFREAIEPVRETLVVWHHHGLRECAACHEVGHPLLPAG